MKDLIKSSLPDNKKILINIAWLKTALHLHSLCLARAAGGQHGSHRSLSFEFLAVVLRPRLALQYITAAAAAAETFIIPHGQIVLAVSREIITKTISMLHKKRGSSEV